MTRYRVLAVLLAAAAVLAGCNADTEPATDVTSSSATLHASVSWENGDFDGGVVYWFETRPSGQLNWTRDEVRDPGSIDDAGGGDVAETVSGLASGRTYEFRACGYLTGTQGERSRTICFDSQGQANGSDYDTFTTDSAIAAPTAFPNPQTAGTPLGWTPASTTSNSITVTTPGAVIQDVRLTNGADIIVQAPNVTIRRVELQGGYIDNDAPTCANGLLVEDTTMSAGPTEAGQEGAVGYGGYTARGVEVTGRSEGFRVSSAGECGPVSVEDSFIKIVPPNPCGDWHGDGIQSWQGDAVTVRNVTIDMRTSGCTGTAPFFRPKDQGNQGAATIDRLLVMGQGYPFRLGTAGTVNGLRVVDGSWIFGPVDVDCSQVSKWDAKSVTIDADYQVTSTVGDIPCSGNGT